MSWCRWIVMSEAWQRPTHSAQDIDPTSRFVPALHHNLPEFVTFHSARRRIRNILTLRSSIATVGRRDPDVLPPGRGVPAGDDSTSGKFRWSTSAGKQATPGPRGDIVRRAEAQVAALGAA